MPATGPILTVDSTLGGHSPPSLEENPMARSTPPSLPGITLTDEEFVALCRALDVVPPRVVAGPADPSDVELAVARRGLVARKLAVPHAGSVVVHPALAGLMRAAGQPATLLHIEVDDRAAGSKHAVALAADDAVIVEHRRSSALGVHHLAVLSEADVSARIRAATSLTPAAPTDVPGFAVRAGALRVALAELERGEAGDALRALTSGGAPIRPARAFAAAVAARVRTVVVAVISCRSGMTTTCATTWVDGGSLGLWRIPSDAAAGSALVEPMTPARLLAEILALLPREMGGVAGYARADTVSAMATSS